MSVADICLVSVGSTTAAKAGWKGTERIQLDSNSHAAWPPIVRGAERLATGPRFLQFWLCAESVLSLGVCENCDGWLVAWGLCG